MPLTSIGGRLTSDLRGRKDKTQLKLYFKLQKLLMVSSASNMTSEAAASITVKVFKNNIALYFFQNNITLYFLISTAKSES